MNINECVLLNKHFVCFHNDKYVKYYCPQSLVDENGIFIYDRLALLLNKIRELKNVNTLKLFYIDSEMEIEFPEYNVDSFHQEEMDSIIFKNIDVEKYVGKILKDNDKQIIVSHRKKNIENITKAINELDFDVSINDITEAFLNDNKSESFNRVYLYMCKEFYFYFIFQSGNLTLFSIIDKTLIYKFVKNNDMNEINRGKNSIDIGDVASVLGEIKDRLVDTSIYELNIFFDFEVEEEIYEYLSFLNYKKVVCEEFFDYLIRNIQEPSINYYVNTKKKHKHHRVKEYMIPVLSFVIFCSVFYQYMELKRTSDTIKEEYTLQMDILENYLKGNPSDQNNKEQSALLNEAVEEYKSQYSFMEISNLDSIINSIASYGQINCIEAGYEYIDIGVKAEQELPSTFDVHILERVKNKDGLTYKLRFKNEEFK